jgi:hypothetical protein
MGKRKRTPEEREALRQKLARWEQEKRDFELMVEELRARWRVEEERRERRRLLLRRLLPFRRTA